MYAEGTHADLRGLPLARDTTPVATSQAIAGVFAMFGRIYKRGSWDLRVRWGNFRPAQPLLINWLEREAMDTVFAVKQPGCLLYNTASSLTHTPLFLLGLVVTFPHRQASENEVLQRGAKFTQNLLPETTARQHGILQEQPELAQAGYT